MPIFLSTLLTFFFLSSPALTAHKGVQLLERGGVWYYPFHKVPLHGRVVVWYENGQMKSRHTYKDGKQSGRWTDWYESGQKKLDTRYKDGQQDGPWTVWDKHGNITKQTTYSHGHEVCTLEIHL